MDLIAFKKQKTLIYNAAIHELKIRADQEDSFKSKRDILIQCIESINTQYINLLNTLLEPVDIRFTQELGPPRKLLIETHPISHHWNITDGHELFSLVNWMCENVQNLFDGGIPIGLDYESN